MDAAAEIEQIVREVLARLQQTPTPAAHLPATVGNASELVLSDKLITAGVLEGKLAGKTTVVVPPKAVVTPAAKDLLRAAKITLKVAEKAEAKAAGAKAASRAHIVLGVAETKFEPAALVTQLRKDLEVEPLARTGLASVAAEVADHVSRNGRLGLLLTDDAAAALCLANRRRGVRAILGASKTAVESGLKTLAANLLVLEPARQSLPAMRQLIVAFARGPRTLAEGYRNHLD